MKDIMIGMDRAFTIYILAVSFLTLILFGVDKWKAIHGKWRIRESILLGLSFIGGAAGGLVAMHLFRHKIRKIRFQIGVPLMLLVQTALWLYLC